MRISLDGRKPEGEWASLNEFLGKGDGTRTKWEIPIPAKDLRGLHIMRDYAILAPNAIRRVLDPDQKLLRDEPDGYKISAPTPDGFATVEFEQPVALGVRISFSVLGRRPETDGKPTGEALKVLPMTDTLAKQLDEKLPPEFRKRKREDNVALPAVQEWNREAYNRLVVDAYGFVDENDQPLDFSNPVVKKSILDTLGSILLGSFAADRARVLQNERQSGQNAELLD